MTLPGGRAECVSNLGNTLTLEVDAAKDVRVLGRQCVHQMYAACARHRIGWSASGAYLDRDYSPPLLRLPCPCVGEKTAKNAVEPGIRRRGVTESGHLARTRERADAQQTDAPRESLHRGGEKNACACGGCAWGPLLSSPADTIRHRAAAFLPHAMRHSSFGKNSRPTSTEIASNGGIAAIAVSSQAPSSAQRPCSS